VIWLRFRTTCSRAVSAGWGRCSRCARVARTVGVKVRDADFVTSTRQRTLAEPTDETDVLFRAALDLARPQSRGLKIRLLGVAASHLEAPQQLRLFAEADARRRRATEAADAIRRRFGAKAIRRARLLDSGVAEPFERDPRTLPDRGVGRAGEDDEPASR
jgi:DNA polymerase-4